MNAPFLTEFSRRAMATEFAVILPGIIGKDAESAVVALAAVESIENELSVYLPHSDISRLNLAAGIRSVRLNPMAIHVLSRASQISRWTDGAFDVTAGPLVEAWGFTKRRGQKPSAEAVAEAKARVGFRNLHVDPANLTAELKLPGMAVNLGAIGKGYALDHIAAELRAKGMTDFLIHGGRSSVLAAGTDIHTPEFDHQCTEAHLRERGDRLGWKVAVEHPLIPGRRLGGILLQDDSLGTSGSGKQFFHHRGRRFGHVIDPRTGWPAGDMLSITVVTKSAMDADALATALFVMGWEAACEFVARHNESCIALESRIAFVATLPTDRQAEVELRTVGFSEGRWLVE